MNSNLTEPNVIYVYSSYTPAQKKAIKKYVDKNRSKINENAKEYYKKQKANDPDFLEKKRQASKTFYCKKKQDMLNITTKKSI